jgi:hypothetical protein
LIRDLGSAFGKKKSPVNPTNPPAKPR